MCRRYTRSDRFFHHRIARPIDKNVFGINAVVSITARIANPRE
jgi:hypothetical protein